MTLSLSIIKDLRSSFLTFTPKNSISETTESTSVAAYLDLLFTLDKVTIYIYITTKLFDKRDAFGFHIVNFSYYVEQYSISTSLWCLCISAHLL